MALAPKRRPKQIFEKVDTNDKRFLSTDKETAASASFVLGEHIRDSAVFEITKPTNLAPAGNSSRNKKICDRFRRNKCKWWVFLIFIYVYKNNKLWQ